MPCLILLARSMVNRFNLVMQMNLFMMISHMSSYLCKLARNIKRTKPFRFKVYGKVKKKRKQKKKIFADTARQDSIFNQLETCPLSYCFRAAQPTYYAKRR